MASHAAQLSYQICPIILTGGGIVSQIPGGILPMLSLFYSTGSALELPYDISNLDEAFAAFNVLPGGTLIQQSIGKYPFANQYVAANAVIRDPLTISVIMDAPMRPQDHRAPIQDVWQIKQMVFSSLKNTLDAHNNRGGTYTVATPAFMYDNLIMTSLTDNSRGNNSLPQNAWRFDFEKPLVALSDAQNAYNLLMAAMANQTPTTAQQTGIRPGTTTAQPSQFNTPAVAGVLSSLGSTTLFGADPSTTNYLPLAPAPAFPFTGIS
jgi:hypothetical protein